MKREVHKLKHEAARHIRTVSKAAKSYGDEAHKHVMEHLSKNIDSYIDKGVAFAADKVKEKVPKVTHGIVDVGAGIVKEKVKKEVKKRLGKKVL